MDPSSQGRLSDIRLARQRVNETRAKYREACAQLVFAEKADAVKTAEETTEERMRNETEIAVKAAREDGWRECRKAFMEHSESAAKTFATDPPVAEGVESDHEPDTEDMSSEEELEEDEYEEIEYEGVEYLEDGDTIYNSEYCKVATWNDNVDDFIWLSEVARKEHEVKKDK
jgi:hypothetical protein